MGSVQAGFHSPTEPARTLSRKMVVGGSRWKDSMALVRFFCVMSPAVHLKRMHPPGMVDGWGQLELLHHPRSKLGGVETIMRTRMHALP